jgi:hypothetical protein
LFFLFFFSFSFLSVNRSREITIRLIALLPALLFPVTLESRARMAKAFFFPRCYFLPPPFLFCLVHSVLASARDKLFPQSIAGCVCECPDKTLVYFIFYRSPLKTGRNFRQRMLYASAPWLGAYREFFDLLPGNKCPA